VGRLVVAGSGKRLADVIRAWVRPPDAPPIGDHNEVSPHPTADAVGQNVDLRIEDAALQGLNHVRQHRYGPRTDQGALTEFALGIAPKTEGQGHAQQQRQQADDRGLKQEQPPLETHSGTGSWNVLDHPC